MLKILSETPLPNEQANRYQGLAYDGNWLYLTHYRANLIDQIDRLGQLHKRYETHRDFSCFCYDMKEHCFWACSFQYSACIFKLNKNFQEIDCLNLHSSSLGLIASLSFHCSTEQLLIACTSGVFFVNTQTGLLTPQEKVLCPSGVLSLGSCYLIWSREQQGTTLNLYDSENHLLSSERVTSSMYMESAILDSFVTDQSTCSIYFLVTKHGRYSYLLQGALQNNFVCQTLAHFRNIFQLEKQPCNAELGCDSVLRSIAQIETSISYLLHAEGDKLNKLVIDDPCKLLEVNQSVNTTLVNATHLEHVLFDKIEALKELPRQSKDS